MPALSDRWRWLLLVPLVATGALLIEWRSGWQNREDAEGPVSPSGDGSPPTEASTPPGEANRPGLPSRIRYDFSNLDGRLVEIVRSPEFGMPTRSRFRVSAEPTALPDTQRLVLTAIEGSLPSFHFQATTHGELSEVASGAYDQAMAIVPITFPDLTPASKRWTMAFSSRGFVTCFLPHEAVAWPETHPAEVSLERQSGKTNSVVFSASGNVKAPDGNMGFLSAAVEFDLTVGTAKQAVLRYDTTLGVFGCSQRLEVRAMLLDGELLDDFEKSIPTPQVDEYMQATWPGQGPNHHEGPLQEGGHPPDQAGAWDVRDLHLTAGQVVPYVLSELVENPQPSRAAILALATNLDELGPEAHLDSLRQALALDDPSQAKKVLRFLVSARSHIPEDPDKDTIFLKGLVALPGIPDEEVGLAIRSMLVSPRTPAPPEQAYPFEGTQLRAASPEALQRVLDAISEVKNPERRQYLYVDLSQVLREHAHLDDRQKDILVTAYSRMLDDAGRGTQTSKILTALGTVRSPASARKMISLYSGSFDPTDVAVLGNVLGLMGTLNEEESTRFLVRWLGDIHNAGAKNRLRDLVDLDKDYQPSSTVRAELAALQREGYFDVFDSCPDKQRSFIEQLTKN